MTSNPASDPPVVEIIDYGMGNLRSVQKALERAGVDARFCTDPRRLGDAAAVVLPGVGAFGDAAAELRRTGFDAAVRDVVDAERPLLGICLGLQLLLDESDEGGRHEGLGIVPGSVRRFDPSPDRKIPHMGWNTVTARGTHAVLADLRPETHFYFVHSHYVRPTDPEAVALTCDYGGEFCAAVRVGSVFVTQFHPEKSQDAGRRLLESFVRQIGSQPAST